MHKAEGEYRDIEELLGDLSDKEWDFLMEDREFGGIKSWCKIVFDARNYDASWKKFFWPEGRVQEGSFEEFWQAHRAAVCAHSINATHLKSIKLADLIQIIKEGQEAADAESEEVAISGLVKDSQPDAIEPKTLETTPQAEKVSVPETWGEIEKEWVEIQNHSDFKVLKALAIIVGNRATDYEELVSLENFDRLEQFLKSKDPAKIKEAGAEVASIKRKLLEFGSKFNINRVLDFFNYARQDLVDIVLGYAKAERFEPTLGTIFNPFDIGKECKIDDYSGSGRNFKITKVNFPGYRYKNGGIIRLAKVDAVGA